MGRGGVCCGRKKKRGGKSYEQLLGRLVQYLRSGIELEDVTTRLRESLMPDGKQGVTLGMVPAGGGRQSRRRVLQSVASCSFQHRDVREARLGCNTIDIVKRVFLKVFF